MVSTVAAKRFTVELERVQKTGTMLRVPFDLEEAFGRARPPVKVTIRGHTWRTTPGGYVAWVEEAKKPETRARRIVATVERVREGLPQR
jgi:hypothetical protein